MACIFIGVVEMIGSLVQRRKNNQIVPGRIRGDKASLEHVRKGSGDARAPTGGVCGIVQDRDNMFVVQWGSTATAADDGQQQQTKSKWPAPPSRLLRGFDPETAERMAAIKQLEAALRRREKVGAEARRLAAQHARVQSARLAHRVVSVVNDF